MRIRPNSLVSILVLLTLSILFYGCRKTKSKAPCKGINSISPTTRKQAIESLPKRLRWSRFPTSSKTLKQLLEAQENPQKPRYQAPSLRPYSLQRLLTRRPLSELHVGQQAITNWLLSKKRLYASSTHYILWGVYHDAGSQITAFQRMARAIQHRAEVLIATELFPADGFWRGPPSSLQSGSDQALLSYFLAKDHSQRAKGWRQLEQQAKTHNYTAWKYRYLKTIMDLLPEAKAHQIPFWGCDMPSQLQKRFKHFGPLMVRLRELHCMQAIRQRYYCSPNNQKIMMLWGMEHVKPSGIRRFISSESSVTSIYVIGDRPSPYAPEARLAKRMVLNAPVLVPIDPTQAVLFLPGRHLKGEVERVQSTTSLDPSTLSIQSPEHGILHLENHTLRLKTFTKTFPLPTTYRDFSPYRFKTQSAIIIGEIQRNAHHAFSLEFDTLHRWTRVIYYKKAKQ